MKNLLLSVIVLLLTVLFLTGCHGMLIGGGGTTGDFLNAADDLSDNFSFIVADVDDEKFDGFNFRVGGYVTPNVALEIFAEHIGSEFDTSVFGIPIEDVDYDSDYFGFNCKIQPLHERSSKQYIFIDPYITVGVGIQYIEIDDNGGFDEEDDVLSFRFAVGAEFDTTTPIRPWVELGTVLPVDDSDLGFFGDVDSSYWGVSFGIVIFFGGGYWESELEELDDSIPSM